LSYKHKLITFKYYVSSMLDHYEEETYMDKYFLNEKKYICCIMFDFIFLCDSILPKL